MWDEEINRDEDEKIVATCDDEDAAELPRVTITQMRHNPDQPDGALDDLVARARRHGYVDVEWNTIETETGKLDRLTGRKPPRVK